ncbi:MAG: hypothetical protein NZ528_13985 [Caldilineales bacterium]|nr:hypothetical protein [Caldilineales bacterium]MDW8316300.1 hypothetical protein [Anaerolineae bacterium]
MAVFLMLILVATIMAAFGVAGYLRGARTMVLSLVILFAVVGLIETRGEQLVTYLNGLYMGVVLTLRSGLSDIASGDLESAAQKLEGIEKPFEGGTANLGLMLILGIAIVAFFIVSAIFKKKRKTGPLGAAVGIVYGYLLAAALLPLLGLPAGLLPIPLLREFDPTALQRPQPVAAGAGAAGGAAQIAQSGLINTLPLVIAVGLAVLLLLSARQTTKSGKKG